MKDVNKKRNKYIEGPEKLIISMLAIVGSIGLLVNEMEVKLICAILFVIGGFILFMSISGKSREIVQEENPEKMKYSEEITVNLHQDSLSQNTQISPGRKSEIANKGFQKSTIENEFFVVKSIQNAKNDSNHGTSQNIDFQTMNKINCHNFFDIEYIKLFELRDPKTEFSNVLEAILGIIKDVIFANTVAFFWINLETKIVIFESKMTNSTQFSLRKKDSFSMGDTLVGRIARQAKSEVISDVNVDAEKDLLGYYNSIEHIKSIIGLPIFYNDMVIAVMTIDSKEEDTYGDETKEQLASFVDLISCLIKSSTEKYDYYIDSLVLNKIEILNRQLKTNPDLTNLINFSLKIVSEIFTWDFLTFCYFDSVTGEWKVNTVVKKDNSQEYISNGAFIEPINSILGSIIKEKKFALINDLQRLQIPKFNRDEHFPGIGSFVAMPIFSDSRVYGAMSLESKRTNSYTIEDAGILNKLCNAISNSLEIVFLKEYIYNKINVDDVTNIAKKEYFYSQLVSALKWIKDYNDFGVFLLISIDKMEELINRYGPTGVNSIFLDVVQILNSNKELYHILGRLNENIFGLFLLRYTLDEGKVFAERIRKNIANNIIVLHNKSFSVTLSIGLIEVSKYLSADQVIEEASRVHRMASEEGGNKVKIL